MTEEKTLLVKMFSVIMTTIAHGVDYDTKSCRKDLAQLGDLLTEYQKLEEETPPEETAPEE